MFAAIKSPLPPFREIYFTLQKFNITVRNRRPQEEVAEDLDINVLASRFLAPPKQLDSAREIYLLGEDRMIVHSGYGSRKGYKAWSSATRRTQSTALLDDTKFQ